MSSINGRRVIIGGFVAGLVMNIIDAITNGVVLGKQWMRESDMLNPNLVAKMTATSTVGWIIVDFIVGILLVWTYAAIRPRFGPGPRTAFRAAFVLWLATHAVFASYCFMGLYSTSLVLGSSIGGLVAMLAGGYIGAMLYREDVSGHDPRPAAA